MNKGEYALLDGLLRTFIEELEQRKKCTCRECLGNYIQDFLERDVE